jgi:D-alanyl-D-alanine carboxypeptidase
MKWKMLALSTFVAVGLVIGAFSIFEVGKPLENTIERSILLAGQDLPIGAGSLGVKSQKTPSQNLSAGKPLVLRDKVSAAEEVVQAPVQTTNVTSKGDNLLVLVNKTIRLSSLYYPKDLVGLDKSIETSYSGMQLRSGAANALLNMFDDAKKKGHDFHVNSAYRSYQTQVSTYNYWVSQVGTYEADRFSARPGHSQHQLGTAVDITSATVDNKLMASFGNTPEGAWLAQNGYKYGFALSYPSGYEQVTGYTYEPWHFRYIGVANATNMKNSGLILELFLQKYGTW